MFPEPQRNLFIAKVLQKAICAKKEEIIIMWDSGLIQNPYLLDWFKTPKPQEELYYTAKDPDEVHNLAEEPSYQKKKEELKQVLFQWLKEVGDKGEVPEKEMVRTQWWNGKDDAPLTKKPKISKRKEGVVISCDTDGASIGYRIFDGPVNDSTMIRPIKTWDFHYLRPQHGKKPLKYPSLGLYIPVEPFPSKKDNPYK